MGGDRKEMGPTLPTGLLVAVSSLVLSSILDKFGLGSYIILVQVRTLEALLKARGLSRSELARMVGVTRQAVSLWFQQEDANIHSRHLLRLSEVLGVSVEELVEPLPCFGPDTHARVRAALLWDRLYPDLDDFAVALNVSDPRAVGRFVEAYGLYAAEKTLGRSVWRNFPNYKKHIHPARRRELETLWAWNKSRKAA